MNSNQAPDGNRSLDGWRPQFTIEVERAQEYIELYEALGNEVRVEPLDPGRLQGDACSACLMAARDHYVVIYLRNRIGKT